MQELPQTGSVKPLQSCESIGELRPFPTIVQNGKAKNGHLMPQNTESPPLPPILLPNQPPFPPARVAALNPRHSSYFSPPLRPPIAPLPRSVSFSRVEARHSDKSRPSPLHNSITTPPTPPQPKLLSRSSFSSFRFRGAFVVTTNKQSTRAHPSSFLPLPSIFTVMEEAPQTPCLAAGPATVTRYKRPTERPSKPRSRTSSSYAPDLDIKPVPMSEDATGESYAPQVPDSTPAFTRRSLQDSNIVLPISARQYRQKAAQGNPNKTMLSPIRSARPVSSPSVPSANLAVRETMRRTESDCGASPSSEYSQASAEHDGLPPNDAEVILQPKPHPTSRRRSLPIRLKIITDNWRTPSRAAKGPSPPPKAMPQGVPIRPLNIAPKNIPRPPPKAKEMVYPPYKGPNVCPNQPLPLYGCTGPSYRGGNGSTGNLRSRHLQQDSSTPGVAGVFKKAWKAIAP